RSRAARPRSRPSCPSPVLIWPFGPATPLRWNFGCGSPRQARCALPERRGPRRTVPCLLCARPVTAAPQPTTGRSQCTRPAGSSLRARTARIFAAYRPSLLHRVLVLDVLAPRLGRTTFVLLVLLLGLVEAFRKPLQVLGHRPHEQHHSDQE